MKSNQSNSLRRGWTLRGTVTEVLNLNKLSTLLALVLGTVLLLGGVNINAATQSYVVSSSPSFVSFSSNDGSIPNLKNIALTSNPATALPFAISANEPWITLSASSGVTQSTLQLGVNPSGLAAGTYTGAVTVTPTGASSMTIPVSFRVTNPVAPVTPAYVISAAPTAFSFSNALNGTAPATKTVVFISTPATPLPFTMSANQSWVTMSATSGVTKSTLQLGVNPAGMAAGRYTALITVTPTGAGNPPMTIPVSLTISAPAQPAYVISAAPTAFSFANTTNGPTPALQTVVFIATPATPLPFTMAASQPWITMSASSGVTKSTIQLGVNTTSMAAGNYTGQIVVTPTGAGNPPMTIPVSLTISAPAAVAPSITSQPAAQTVNAGQTASFSVAASGTSPLSYQWNKNGAAIAGATGSSYTTPATLSTDNNATFAVTISNSVSAVTSSTATLTVSVNYVISAAPTAFSFAGTLNGTAPSQQTVVFISTPATPLPFNMSANQSWITMSATSGVTKSTIQLGVNPAGLAIGSYTGLITVTPTGAGDPPMTIPVSLVITAATPGTLSSNVSSLNFSNVNVGTSSSQQAIITNTGSNNVNISNVSISGAGFTVSGVPAGTILTQGQTATLNVTFDPSAAGNATGSVTVSSNASNSTDTLGLSGVGVQVTPQSVSLTWSEAGTTATGYNTYQATVSGGAFTKLNSSPDAAQSYTDTTVQAGQTYYYVVTSVNAAGMESAYSNQVSIAVPLS
jgi:hypothetical protein